MEALALVAKASSRHSLYKGVTLYKPTNKWRAQISHGGRTVTLGDYNTEEEAARVFDRACICKYGTDAVCNFPMEDYRAEWDDLQATSIPGLLVKFKEERQRNKTARALYDIKVGQQVTSATTTSAMVSRPLSRPRQLPRQQGSSVRDPTHHDPGMSQSQDAYISAADAATTRPLKPCIGAMVETTATRHGEAEDAADGGGGSMGYMIRVPCSGVDGESNRRTDIPEHNMQTILRPDATGYFAWDLRPNHLTAPRAPLSSNHLNHLAQQHTSSPVTHTRSPAGDTETPTVSGYQWKHQRLPLSRGSSSSSPEVARLTADGSPHLMAAGDWSAVRHATGSDSSDQVRVEAWETPVEPGSGGGGISVYKSQHGGMAGQALALAAAHNLQRVFDGSSDGRSGTEQQLLTVNDRSSLLATASSNAGLAPMAWQYGNLGSKLRNTTTFQPTYRPPVVLNADRRTWARGAGTMYDINCQPTYVTVTSDRMAVDTTAARRSASAGYKRSSDSTAELVSLTQGGANGGHVSASAAAAGATTTPAFDDPSGLPISRLGSLDLRSDSGLMPSRSSSVINFNGRPVLPLELVPAKRLRITESPTVAPSATTVTISEEPQKAASAAGYRDQPPVLRQLVPNRFQQTGGLPTGLSYNVDANNNCSQGKGPSLRTLESAAGTVPSGTSAAVALKSNFAAATNTGLGTNGATANGRPTIEALKQLLVAALLQRQEEEEAQERLRQQQRQERQVALRQIAMALGLQPLLAADAEALLGEVLAAAAAANGHGPSGRQVFSALSPPGTGGGGGADGSAMPPFDVHHIARLVALMNGRQTRPSSGTAPSSNGSHLSAAAGAVQSGAAAAGELCDRRGVTSVDVRGARPAATAMVQPTRLPLQLPASGTAQDLADGEGVGGGGSGGMISLRSAGKMRLHGPDLPMPVVVRLPMHMSGGSSQLRGVLQLDDGITQQQQQQQRLVLKPQEGVADFTSAGLPPRMRWLPVRADS